jgi:cell division protein FtsX
MSDQRQAISSDNLLQIIGVKEVEIHMLRQQIEQLQKKMQDENKQSDPLPAAPLKEIK